MYLCDYWIVVACDRSCICVLVESLWPVSRHVFVWLLNRCGLWSVMYLFWQCGILYLHLNTTWIYTCVLVSRENMNTACGMPCCVSILYWLQKWKITHTIKNNSYSNITSFIGYINYNNNVNTWCSIIYLQLSYWKGRVITPIIIRYITTTKWWRTTCCVCYITRRITSIYNECSSVVGDKVLECSCNENRFKSFKIINTRTCMIG